MRGQQPLREVGRPFGAFDVELERVHVGPPGGHASKRIHPAPGDDDGIALIVKTVRQRLADA